MRKFRRMMAAAALLFMAAAPCHAQDMAFGGRGEDAIYEAVPADGGFFAVGTTASSDGDLASRTRAGETGWAIRVGADGRILWDFCSSRSGMLTMTAPRAYPDGRFSLVLTDETRQRGEWIVLSANGKQESRAAIPDTSALCPDGEPGEIIAMTPSHGDGGPYLLLILLHEDSGALCCSALSPDGAVYACGKFYGDADGALLPLDGGGVLHVGAELGALALTRLSPGAQIERIVLGLDGDGVGLGRVTDALVGGDGSVALCGQTVTADQKSDGLLLRVNAEGETLFARTLEEDGALSLLAETDTGYAVYAQETGRVLFFDEDGAQQGGMTGRSALLDLLPADGGVLGLSHDAERGRRQAMFTRIARPEQAQQEIVEAALPDVQMTAEPTASPVIARTPVPRSETSERIALDEGHLLCSGGYGGVTVSRVDGAGHTLWQTRIPIHTAADRLVWERAEITSEGEILLAGYYETDMPEGTLREGAMALLGADGVLKDIGLTE